MIDLFSNISYYLHLRMRTYSDNRHTTSLLTHSYLYFGQQCSVASGCFIPVFQFCLWNLQFAAIRDVSQFNMLVIS